MDTQDVLKTVDAQSGPKGISLSLTKFVLPELQPATSDPSWLHTEISARYFPAVQILERQPRKPKTALHAASSAAKDLRAQDLGHRTAVIALPNSDLDQGS